MRKSTLNFTVDTNVTDEKKNKKNNNIAIVNVYSEESTPCDF